MPYDANPAATHDPTSNVVVPVNWLDLLNANFAYLGAAWTAFTPAMTFSGGGSLTIGNGSISGAYRQVGKTLDVNIDLRVGSTTSFGTGDWRFTLPNSLTSVARRQAAGVAYGYDSSPVGFKVGVALAEPSVAYLSAVHDGATALWASTVPITWANGDLFSLSAHLEVA